MRVIYVCPGAPGGPAEHWGNCCETFVRQPLEKQQETGRQVPAPEVPDGGMFLRQHTVDLLEAVALGEVWWVVQRTATYGHRGGHRCTKTLRFLADAGMVTLPAASGFVMPTAAGRATLAFYPPYRWAVTV